MYTHPRYRKQMLYWQVAMVEWRGYYLSALQADRTDPEALDCFRRALGLSRIERRHAVPLP